MDNSVATIAPAVFRPPNARKRARLASPSHTRTPSRYDGNASKRGKDVAGLPAGLAAAGPTEYRDTGHSNKVMTPVSSTAAILTAATMSSVSANQESGFFLGHESTTREPTTAPGQLNHLSGEIGTAIPNPGSQPIDYTPFSPPFTADRVPGFTSFPSAVDFQFWDTLALPFCVTMNDHTAYPLYGQSMPPHGLGQEHQPYPTLSIEAVPDYDPSTMASHPDPDHTFPFPGVPPCHAQFPFDGYAGFPPPDMNDGFPDWENLSSDNSGEDTDQTSPGAPSCSDPSPSHTNDYVNESEDYYYIPYITDPPLAVDCRTLSVRSSSQSTRSSRNGGPKNIGGRKSALTADQRDQASNTRRLVACLRCQYQRNPCKVDPRAPDGPCLACNKIREKESRKVIHRLPCERWKLTSVTTFRSGGLEFTERPGWEGAALKDLGPGDWADDSAITIHMTLGLCDEPLEFRVRKFKVLPGDITDRTWTYKGVKYVTKIEPYALEDIHKTKAVLQSHIRANAYDGVKRYAEENSRVHNLVKETYKAAWNHMRTVEYKSATDIDAKSLMEELFKLWFATKNTLGSAWLLGQPGTEETLGMWPDTRDGYPFPGKISAPRLLCQQFDAINFNTMLTPWKSGVLAKLWKLMQGKKDPKIFYTIYLCVFIILHEASSTSKDRYWHNKHQNKSDLRYDMHAFMEELQEGANIVLWCWHYYRRGFNPLDADWEKIRDPDEKEGLYTHIKPDEEKLMRKLAEISRMGTVPETKTEKTGWDGLVFDTKKPSPLVWERDLHFVSQMFHENWYPRPTWSRSSDNGQSHHA